MRLTTAILALLSATRCPAADDPVTIRDVDGATTAVRLTAFDTRRLSWTTANGAKGELPRSKLLRIDRRRAARRTETAKAFVYLANGDRLAVAASHIAGDDLHVLWTGIPEKPSMKLPLQSVRAMILKRPESRTDFENLEAALQGHRQKADLIVLRNGDRVTGRLKSLTASVLVMSGSTGEIPRANVLAVAFDPQYVETPESTSERLLVLLDDGTRVSAKTAALTSGGKLRLSLLTGGQIQLAWASVVSMQRLGGNVRALSALTPATFEHTPYLDGKRTLQSDRNALGRPLTLRGREYLTGLGMHSRSHVSYDIPPGAESFLATIGIDDAARGRGAAVFVIQLDGKPVYTSPVLTGRDPPRHIGPIRLTGHKRLTLLVEFGPQGDILDYANWCDAVLILRQDKGRKSDQPDASARESRGPR